MTTQKTKIDYELSLKNTLGIDRLDPTIGDRYGQLRSSSAENTLALLAAQDQEYARRQGERNLSFIKESVGHLPYLAYPFFSANHTSRYRVLSTDRVDTNHFSEISLPFVMSELGEIDGETLSELSSIRATTIWISRDIEDVFELPSDHDYYRDKVKNKLERDTTDVPYVIVGHRLLNNGGYTELILMPLTRSSSRDVGHHPEPLTVRMTTEAYARLIQVQDTLLGEGLTPDEVKQIHDSKEGTFTIEPGTINCVRATMRRSAMGMAMSAMPDDHTDLEEDFDLQQTDTVLSQIHPSEFTNYNVLSDMQRLFAMFGALAVFEKLNQQLLESSLQDPALKLLES